MTNMNIIKKVQLNQLGFSHIDKKYMPNKNEEVNLRDIKANHSAYSSLSNEAINILVGNGNSADDWLNIKVTENFNPEKVKNNRFFGFIRIGDMDDIYLDFEGLMKPVGLYNSTIISSDIGSNVSVENVNFLSHCIIKDTVILNNVNEIFSTRNAKFDNGIIRTGENKNDGFKIKIGNENGMRAIFPFNGMLPGDAYLCSKHKEDSKLMFHIQKMTQAIYDGDKGFYSYIDECSVIKNCRKIKDVKIGSHARIDGCNKLENLTINSSMESSTSLGEGSVLINGIVGYGCSILYNVIAINFLISNYSNLKHGVRFLDSFLGSNSTISCCEVLNSLIFPGHEQHHNNSFLCAATIKGLSNIASGATIGSNHNSRANDGEIIAERGFWPGLCTSFKHNSKFSSFNLVAKGAYPAEINNPFPFSLILNNEKDSELTIMPGYWFLYNLYALARNSWKYSKRDKRIKIIQKIEFDYLAPDTINEILEAMDLLVLFTKKSENFEVSREKDPIAYLKNNPNTDLLVDSIENSKRKTRLVKIGKAYKIYEDFILYYIFKTLLLYSNKTSIQISSILEKQYKSKNSRWLNIGGQLVQEKDLNSLKNDIKNNVLKSWDEVHARYRELSESYEHEKVKHAVTCYKLICNKEQIHIYREKFKEVSNYIYTGTLKSREKDFSNPYRSCVYDNKMEMMAVLGEIGDDSFIKHIEEETDILINLAEKYLK